MEEDDSVTIAGLSEVLEEEAELPYLDLALRCRERAFRAAVLVSEDGWTLNVRDERGRSMPGSGEVYDTQPGAVLAALLIALDTARRRLP